MSREEMREELFKAHQLCATAEQERDRLRAHLALSRGALNQLAAEECAFTGSYEDCFEAIANDEIEADGPCPKCIATRTIGLLDTTPGASHPLGLLDGATCPCKLVEPCSSSCSCASPVMSGGCMCCASYGSQEQKLAAAARIRSLTSRIQEKEAK